MKKKIKTKSGDTFLLPLRENRICISNALKDAVYNAPELMLHFLTLNVDEKVEDFIKNHSHMIEQIDNGNLKYYLNELLLSSKPSTYIIKMRNLGLLEYIIPELIQCEAVYQHDKFHKYDVFEHCIYTMDNTPPDLSLRLAGLLHDIGKPSTYKIIKGYPTFHKHDVIGASITYKILKRLGYNKPMIRSVVQLVRLHMYHYTRSWSDKAVKRFIKKVGIDDTNIENLSELPLFKLRAADRMGGGTKYVAVTELQKKFEDRIRKVYYKSIEENREKRIFQMENKLNGISKHELERIFTPEVVEDEGIFDNIIEYLYKLVSNNKIPNKKLDLLGESVRYIKLNYC